MGRAAVDLYGEQIGGRLEDMLTFTKYMGGSPANTAVGMARLGLKPAMLTRVGDEHNGRFVRETLQAEGVDVSHVTTDPKRLTALVFLGIQNRARMILTSHSSPPARPCCSPEHTFRSPIPTPAAARPSRWPRRPVRGWCWTSTIVPCSGG
jgi:5-dehydro-2-deoxygluconokinase